MKLSWRTELPQWIVIAAMFTVAACVWSQVPDRIPIHWNIRGEVDGYGGKFLGLLLLPLIAAGLYGLMIVVPLVDPGRGNYPSFSRAFNVIRMALVFFLAAIYSVTVVAAFGRPVDMTTVACLGSAALFVLIGNCMGKIRPNWFVGVSHAVDAVQQDVVEQNASAGRLVICINGNSCGYHGNYSHYLDADLHACRRCGMCRLDDRLFVLGLSSGSRPHFSLGSFA